MNAEKDRESAGEGDRALVREAAGGNSRAFELLVLKYQERILRLVRRLVGRQEQVEDLAQEVFLRAYRSLGTFKGDSAFYTWLYKVALNTCRNYYRSLGRRPEGSVVDDDKILDEMASGGTSPEGQALRREMWEAVKVALDALPSEQREAVVLCDLEGLSYEEIGEVAGIPVGTVRSRVFRGRKALQRRLGPYMPGGGKGERGSMN